MGSNREKFGACLVPSGLVPSGLEPVSGSFFRREEKKKNLEAKIVIKCHTFDSVPSFFSA